jgi:Zn-dependent protease
MMGSGNGNITIGHVWGLPIQINPSLFLILGLVTWTLARPGGLLPAAYPEMSATGSWLTALLTALLFFSSILFHELAHAWVARRNDVPVVSITLYIFGGIAQLGGNQRPPAPNFALRPLAPPQALSSPPFSME